MKTTNPLPLSFFKIIWTVGKNTYREVIRDKLLYGIGIIAILLTAASFFMATISLDQNARILQNIGLATIHLFSFFITVFVVTNSMNKDIERRALYFLFPKPISRAQYVLGKYVGIILVLLTTLGILGGLFTLGALFTDRSIVAACLINLSYSFLELSFMGAFALLFSIFTAPLNAALYSIGLFIIGHSLGTMKDFIDKTGTVVVQKLIAVIYYILPNLEKFDVRSATLYRVSIPASQVWWTLFYWALYLGIVLYLAVLTMRKREF
jgi:Cu-processing system permease protein